MTSTVRLYLHFNSFFSPEVLFMMLYAANGLRSLRPTIIQEIMTSEKLWKEYSPIDYWKYAEMYVFTRKIENRHKPPLRKWLIHFLRNKKKTIIKKLSRFLIVSQFASLFIFLERELKTGTFESPQEVSFVPIPWLKLALSSGLFLPPSLQQSILILYGFPTTFFEPSDLLALLKE